MDVTSSVLTIVSSAWTLSIRLKQLIGKIKVLEESVQKLEDKAETLATVIRCVQNAYEPQDKRTDYSHTHPAAEDTRRMVLVVIKRCKDDLEKFERELSNILKQRTGRFGSGSVMKMWRQQFADPTFARIEESIESHQCSLQILLDVLHTHHLDSTRKAMEERLDAVLERLHLLAVSPQSPIQQDASAEVVTEPLRHCDTDTTLVESTRGTEVGGQLIEEWLGCMTDEDGIPVPSDSLAVIASLEAEDSALKPRASQHPISRFVSPQFEKNKNVDAQLRKFSSPKLSPSEFPIPLPPTVARSSEKSLDLELPNEPPRMIRMDYTPICSKSCTQNESASREFLQAVTRKDMNCMKSLLESNLKPDIEYSNPDNDKRTPLLLAVQLGHIEMVKFLLSQGANIEATDESETTPLMTAASLGKVDIMKELLLQGADVQARNKTRRTALHLAIQKSRDRAISFLLNLNNTDQYGSVDHRKTIDVNACDKSGKTPLHYCAELGMLEAATMLLDRHANFDAHDGADKAPAYYAIKYRKYFIVKLLLAHKANFSQQWPPDPTSKEIEDLLKRQGWRRPSLESGSSRNEGAEEGPERRGPGERKGSWISSRSPKFRKKSNAEVID